jgi:hypothetical protein
VKAAKGFKGERDVTQLQEKTMPEARQAERVKSLLRAQIIFNNRMTTVDCVIKNISKTGAKLALNNTLSIPSEFDIYVPQKSHTYRARLVWRDKDAMGVEFLDMSDAAPPSALAVDARVRELELQNAELRARILALSKRLQDLGQDPNLAA